MPLAVKCTFRPKMTSGFPHSSFFAETEPGPRHRVTSRSNMCMACSAEAPGSAE